MTTPTGQRRPPHNPFVISLLAEGTHFANREGEVARMVRAFCEPGAKLLVYGERRLGKSSAMERAAEEVRRQGEMVAVAAFSTASDAAEAAQRVLSAVQKEIGTSWREVLGRIAESLNTSVEINPSADPGALPSVKFGFALERPDVATKLLPDVLDAINHQMERRRATLGLGLDEFQRIHEWGGEDAEWALRDAMQRQRALSYVLAGSKRHLIEAMVAGKGRAFWKLMDILEFGPMDEEVLAEWIVEQGAATGVRIPLKAAQLIVHLAWPRTRDVVQLARAVWDRAVPQRKAAVEDVAPAMEQLVHEQSALYETIWTKLNPRQQMILRAFAMRKDIQITASETLRRYQLGAKSSVQSTVEGLIEAEHLTRAAPGGYAFDDPFYRRWVQVYGLPDIGFPTPPLLPPSSSIP